MTSLSANSTISNRAAEILDEFITSNDVILYACLSSGSGDILAEAKRGSDSTSFRNVTSLINDMTTKYPRVGLSRIYVEDDEAVMVLVRLNSGLLLLGAAKKEASLGAVTVNMTRLAAKLD